MERARKKKINSCSGKLRNSIEASLKLRLNRISQEMVLMPNVPKLFQKREVIIFLCLTVVSEGKNGEKTKGKVNLPSNAIVSVNR